MATGSSIKSACDLMIIEQCVIYRWKKTLDRPSWSGGMVEVFSSPRICGLSWGVKASTSFVTSCVWFKLMCGQRHLKAWIHCRWVMRTGYPARDILTASQMPLHRNCSRTRRLSKDMGHRPSLGLIQRMKCGTVPFKRSRRVFSCVLNFITTDWLWLLWLE